MEVSGSRGRVRARNVVIASVGAAALAVALSAPARASTTWIGSARGTIERSNKFVSGGTSWQGTFRIRVGRGGAVHGYATVGYTPNIDVSGLNNAINYLRSNLNAALGPLLGPFAPAVTVAQLGSIEGVGVSFREALAIRRGTLSGRMAGGRLTLHWNAPLKSRPIPYRILLVLVVGDKQIGKGNAPLLDPFSAGASLIQRGEAVTSSESTSSSGGVAQEVDSYWVAHRVN